MRTRCRALLGDAVVGIVNVEKLCMD